MSRPYPGFYQNPNTNPNPSNPNMNNINNTANNPNPSGNPNYSNYNPSNNTIPGNNVNNFPRTGVPLANNYNNNNYNPNGPAPGPGPTPTPVPLANSFPNPINSNPNSFPSPMTGNPNPSMNMNQLPMSSRFPTPINNIPYQNPSFSTPGQLAGPGPGVAPSPSVSGGVGSFPAPAPLGPGGFPAPPGPGAGALAPGPVPLPFPAPPSNNNNTANLNNFNRQPIPNPGTISGNPNNQINPNRFPLPFNNAPNNPSPNTMPINNGNVNPSSYPLNNQFNQLNLNNSNGNTNSNVSSGNNLNGSFVSGSNVSIRPSPSPSGSFSPSPQNQTPNPSVTGSGSFGSGSFAPGPGPVPGQLVPTPLPVNTPIPTGSAGSAGQGPLPGQLAPFPVPSALNSNVNGSFGSGPGPLAQSQNSFPSAPGQGLQSQAPQDFGNNPYNPGSNPSMSNRAPFPYPSGPINGSGNAGSGSPSPSSASASQAYNNGGTPSSNEFIQSPNQRAQTSNNDANYNNGNQFNEMNQNNQASNQSSVNRNKKVERIDQRQIPRPEFKSSSSDKVKFYTRSGHAPPSAASDFTVIDEGNCSPRFIRLTTNNIAAEAELVDQTKLCIGAILQPLAALGEGEEPIPVIDYPKGPVRCNRCLAYVNPFFQFVEQGAKFICNICQTKNDVPDDYRCNIDQDGFRRDKFDRPELSKGSVEFVVGSEFLSRPITDPHYLFVIDVSYGAMVSGLVETAVSGIRCILESDQVKYDERLKIGIITYDDAVQFYSLKKNADQPEILIMCDVDSVFLPCPPEEIFVSASLNNAQSRNLLFALLDMLPTMYDRSTLSDDTSNNEAQSLLGFGAAVAAGCEALLLTGGKLLVLQSNLPSFGVGALQNRDNAALYRTDKEKTLMVPQSSYYLTLATKCAEAAISVDLFVASNGYVDLATIGHVSDKTGGQVYVYPGFDSSKDSLALIRDLYHNCTRLTGYDAVMIVRCSTGLRVAEHFGNFYYRRLNEMELASIDADKAFGIRIEHESKLVDKSDACVQCALLYTTHQGQRRIRVHTLSVPVTSTMSTIFRYSDLDAIINLSLKQAVRQLLDQTSCSEAQTALSNACIDSLFVYRKFCASATSAGQLILPEPLKLLPLCTLALIKHPLFSDGLPADERSFLFHSVLSMPSAVSVAFVCPRLFSLCDLPANTCVPDSEGRVFLPVTLTLSSSSIHNDAIYLLDDSRFLYLFIASHVSKEMIDEIFVRKVNASNTSTHLELRNEPDPNHLSTRISVLISTLRRNKPAFQNLQIIIASNGQSIDEGIFFSHLVEDASSNASSSKSPNSMSYIDFLCWIHKQIQNKFY